VHTAAFFALLLLLLLLLQVVVHGPIGFQGPDGSGASEGIGPA
jgi:hypothetical protein